MEPITKIDIDMATEDAIYITLLGGRKLKYIPEKQAQKDFMELYEALYNILYLLDDHKPISTNHLNTLYDEIQKAQQSPLFKKGGDA